MADPVIKDRAHGWIGSRYVGVEEAMAGQQPKPAPAPAPAPAAPIGSQGKLPGEWIGSRYVGPGGAAAPAAAPKPAAPAAPAAGAPPSNAPAPVAPAVVGSQGKKPGEWIGSKYVGPAQPAADVYNPTTNPGGQTLPDRGPMNTSPSDPRFQNINEGGINPDDLVYNTLQSNLNPGAAPGQPTPTPGDEDIDPYLSPEEKQAIRQANANRQYERDNPQYVDALQNYWAPDREEQLARLRAESTQPGGAAYVAPTAAAPAAAPTTPAAARRPRGALEGFVKEKLDDPTKGTSHKYVGGRILAAGGGVDEVLADPMFKGWTKVSDDKIKSPEGTVYDLFRDQEGANAPQWTRIGGTGPAGKLNDGIPGNAGGGGDIRTHVIQDDFGLGRGGYAQGYPSGTGDWSTPGGAITHGIPGAGYNFDSGYGGADDAINEGIMRLLARGETPIDPNDPLLQGQYQPIRNVMERASQITRAQAAERAGAEGRLIGGGGGSFSGEVNSINEDLAGKEGQLMSQLVTSELQARRGDVVNALQLAQGSQRLQLQNMLAALDRELERERLKQQNQQYYDDLGYRIGRDEYLFNQNENDRLPA